MTTEGGRDQAAIRVRANPPDRNHMGLYGDRLVLNKEPLEKLMPKLIDLPIEQAKHIKWQAGRKKYGAEGDHFKGKFVGDPIEHLYDELIDALNYADEAERQGVNIGVVRPELLRVAEMVGAIHDLKVRA